MAQRSRAPVIGAGRQGKPSVRFEVHIQPRASRTEIAGSQGDAIKIRIAAPPVDNAANRALIDFIADRLGIAKQCVRIVSGCAHRRKLLEIDGVTAEEATARLQSTDRRPSRA